MQLRTLSPRRLTGAAALACAAALIPVAALAATASPAEPAGMPACATSGLVVWMNTQGSAAAGTVYYTLKFTNLSGHACTLRGNPGVSAVSLTGRRLGSPANWIKEQRQTVKLAQGATAYALLHYSDVVTGNSGPKPCHAVTGAGLRIYPPNQTASKIVPIPLTACTTRGLVYMSVEPVQKAVPPGNGS